MDFYVNIIRILEKVNVVCIVHEIQQIFFQQFIYFAVSQALATYARVSGIASGQTL